jgi:hypothetical protein
MSNQLDVTSHKEAERALIASEARYCVVAEQSHDMVIHYDAHGVIKWCCQVNSERNLPAKSGKIDSMG